MTAAISAVRREIVCVGALSPAAIGRLKYKGGRASAAEVVGDHRVMKVRRCSICRRDFGSDSANACVKQVIDRLSLSTGDPPPTTKRLIPITEKKMRAS